MIDTIYSIDKDREYYEPYHSYKSYVSKTLILISILNYYRYTGQGTTFLQFLFSLYKPPAYTVVGLFWAALKEEIALFSLNDDGITVTLAAGPHRSCLTDIRDSVDIIFTAVFPGDFSGKHDPIGAENDLDLNIDFNLLVSIAILGDAAALPEPDHAPTQI